MRLLFQAFALILLVGCATPYYPVYATSKGDYYIAERQTSGPYFGPDTILFNDVGIYPWWSGGYPVELFSYYSPYYYPHYFSIWYPPGYHPFHGFYGGYYAYWCPPYRLRRHHGAPQGSGSMGSPVMPPSAVVATRASEPGLWRSIDRLAVNKELMIRRSNAWGSDAHMQTIPAYSRRSGPSIYGESMGRSSRPNSPARSFRSLTSKSITIHKE
jgi:hypothetical protein